MQFPDLLSENVVDTVEYSHSLLVCVHAIGGFVRQFRRNLDLSLLIGIDDWAELICFAGSLA